MSSSPAAFISCFRLTRVAPSRPSDIDGRVDGVEAPAAERLCGGLPLEGARMRSSSYRGRRRQSA